MADVISSLWIGDALGLMERLSIASFLRHGHEYHLYCYDEVANVPAGATIKDANEILPASSNFCYEQGPGKGSVAAFSNLFRYKLLLDRGGWWVDADVVCLRSFDFVEPVIISSEHSRSSWQIATAALKLPPGHPIARLCFEHAASRDSRTLFWSETGPQLVHAIVVTNKLIQFIKGANVFCPIPWWGWRLFLCEDASACEAFLFDAPYAIHLWHELWRRAGVDRQATFPPTSVYAQLLKTNGVEPSA